MSLYSYGNHLSEAIFGPKVQISVAFSVFRLSFSFRPNLAPLKLALSVNHYPSANIISAWPLLPYFLHSSAAPNPPCPRCPHSMRRTIPRSSVGRSLIQRHFRPWIGFAAPRSLSQRAANISAIPIGHATVDTA